MNIGELAEKSGVPAKTIRYYEESGLIPPAKRDTNGYRIYDPSDVERLAFLRRARSFDFSIDECRALLNLLGDPRRKSADVKRLTERHIAELDKKLKELRALRRQLSELADACSGDEGAECAILDALVSGT
jgi:Cu(I)-responsive transcriptional regulator